MGRDQGVNYITQLRDGLTWFDMIARLRMFIWGFHLALGIREVSSRFQEPRSCCKRNWYEPRAWVMSYLNSSHLNSSSVVSASRNSRALIATNIHFLLAINHDEHLNEMSTYLIFPAIFRNTSILRRGEWLSILTELTTWLPMEDLLVWVANLCQDLDKLRLWIAYLSLESGLFLLLFNQHFLQLLVKFYWGRLILLGGWLDPGFDFLLLLDSLSLETGRILIGKFLSWIHFGHLKS